MKRTFATFFSLTLITLMLFSVLAGSRVSADPFNQNRIIDDPIFDNANSMSAAQIDAFLNGFSASCISPNSGFKAVDPTGYNPTNGFQYGGFVTAGQVIADSAQVYGINPQVLITTLEKEQSLVTGRSNFSGYCNNGDQHKYAAAVGYGCPDSGTSYSYSGLSLYQRNGTTISDTGTTCVNSAAKAGFSQQVIRAAWLLKFGEQRSEGDVGWAVIKGNWNNSDDPQTCYGGSMTQGTFARCPSGASAYYDGYTTIDSTSVHIDTGATAALYWYTPHFHGNQNFFDLFTGWFGSTYAFVNNGVNYAIVFDPAFYLANNPDVQSATGGDKLGAFNHFLYYGMNEGRQGNANFNVTSYRNRYPDLRWMFGKNLKSYYIHYITNGQFENRLATGTVTLQPVTSYGGVDYSNVYDFSTYLSINSDLAGAYNNDDTGALRHFINYGMNEGRQANTNFNVQSYKARYFDLRRAFGDNPKPYYLHFVTNGKTEGRVATGSYVGGTTVLNGLDYSAVYNLNDYENYNSDIKSKFGLSDVAALQHFVNYGMNEGRQASTTFNVAAYKARYADLRAAFGNNLKAYYLHFVTNGKAEGRTGV